MCTVLLVEDDHKLRASLVTLLDEAGYPVIPAGTVSESMRLITKHSFGLAIVDLKLPNGSGFRIVEEIVEEIPSIILTGYPSHEARNRANVLGVKAFLEKPFNEEALIKIIDSVVKTGEAPLELSREYGPHSRKIGDDVDLSRVYQKTAVISTRLESLEERFRRLEGDIVTQDEGLAKVREHLEKVKNSINERLVTLEVRGRVSGQRWQWLIGAVLAVMQSIIIWLLTRS